MDSKAYLYFENGSLYEANSFGYKIDKPYLSEIVFNTSMQGYQEILTDPSYCSQSLVMTYPSIGNYGINLEDNESITPHIKTLIVKDYCKDPSNFRSRLTLQSFLQNNQVHGLSNLDTRSITKLIRSIGSSKIVISNNLLNTHDLNELFLKELETNQVSKVSTKSTLHFSNSTGPRVVIIDYGYKKNILESLIERNCDVSIVPFNTTFEEIMSLSPSGVVLSNGPGDPNSIKDCAETIQKLQTKIPIFGICMGHQLFAIANGAKTEKMVFGNRGANHPVKNLTSNKIYLTSQNHGYCVSKKSVQNTELETTEVNLNDGTIEGLKHKKLPCFSVQYHPESAPGPNDTKFLFDLFINNLKGV